MNFYSSVIKKGNNPINTWAKTGTYTLSRRHTNGYYTHKKVLITMTTHLGHASSVPPTRLTAPALVRTWSNWLVEWRRYNHRKIVWQILIKFDINLPYDPTIPILNTYPRERKQMSIKDLYMDVSSRFIQNILKM